MPDIVKGLTPGIISEETLNILKAFVTKGYITQEALDGMTADGYLSRDEIDKLIKSRIDKFVPGMIDDRTARKFEDIKKMFPELAQQINQYLADNYLTTIKREVLTQFEDDIKEMTPGIVKETMSEQIKLLKELGINVSALEKALADNYLTEEEINTIKTKTT